MDRRIRKSKNALKKALITLMYKKHISYISISELCIVADVNRSTFYSNYGNITELISDIHYDLFEDMFLKQHSFYTMMQLQEHREDTIYNMVSYIENHKDEVTILFRNNENSLLEQNLLQFFMDACNINSVEYKKAYPFIYHTGAFLTLLHIWVKDNYPCSAKELTKVIVEESLPLRKYFTENLRN